jgi:hypothetical protein
MVGSSLIILGLRSLIRLDDNSAIESCTKSNRMLDLPPQVLDEDSYHCLLGQILGNSHQSHTAVEKSRLLPMGSTICVLLYSRPTAIPLLPLYLSASAMRCQPNSLASISMDLRRSLSSFGRRLRSLIAQARCLWITPRAVCRSRYIYQALTH